MKILEVKGLKVSYGLSSQQYIYPDFSLHEGGSLAVMGSTGCGKTTLLNALFSPFFTGYMEYTKINLLERDIKQYKKKLFHKVSYMPQFSQNALNPCLTVKGHIAHIKRQEGNLPLIEEAKILLKELRLDEDVLNKYPHQLSGGMKQRVVLLLGFLKRPSLLVLDEPSTAIDAITLQVIVNFLKKKKQEGVSMLMVSHDIGFIRCIAEDIVYLDGEMQDA